jgi:hypothetical protein
VEDPLLLWWCQNESRFPEVALVAKRWLAVPATSAPCERLFSTCRRASSGDRARISPERLEAIVRLHENSRKKSSARVSYVVPVAVAAKAAAAESDSDE